MEGLFPLAIIGGSGLYHIPGLQNSKEYDLETPFGKPSAPVVTGTLEGKPVAFLARHGIGHTISPSEINNRANIYALKMLGVQQIVSISACGSLREDYAPGHMILPDQLFDFTLGSRVRSFFEKGLVAHIGTAEPYCSNLVDQVADAAHHAGAKVHRGGTLITIEGPRFSTKAESQLFRAWGMSVIGMTACPEAFLAREAEICYVTLAHVTDYDVWHVSEEAVSVEIVIRTLNQNTEIAQQAIRYLAKNLVTDPACDCHHALQNALITDPDRIPPQTREKLGLLVDKYLSK
jgi:5'-methylthioadenosine phosphorylase